MKDWQGEGWYIVVWSDGGMDWTNNGPVWFERECDLDNEILAANEWATDTHLPSAQYLGNSDEPEE